MHSDLLKHELSVELEKLGKFEVIYEIHLELPTFLEFRALAVGKLQENFLKNQLKKTIKKKQHKKSVFYNIPKDNFKLNINDSIDSDIKQNNIELLSR